MSKLTLDEYLDSLSASERSIADAAITTLKAQSESVYQWRCKGNHVWSDGKVPDFGPMGEYESRVLYSAPPADDRFDSERNVRPGDIGTETDDRPTWKKVQDMIEAGCRATDELDPDTRTDIAERIIAEFRKERGK